MKKIILFVLIVFIFFSTSCSKDTTQEAKNEFTKYYNGNNEVVLILDYKSLFFENSILKLKDIDSSMHIGTIMLCDNKIYYISYENLENKSILINFKWCDYFGNNTTILFTKKVDVNKFQNIDEYVFDNIFYIKYMIDDIVYLDSFNVITEQYLNIMNGKDCNLSDYIQEEKSQYNIEVTRKKSPKEHGVFIVTDSKTGIKKIIDDEYLKNTIYIESMNKYNYEPLRYDISKGHILLTYEIGAGDGWNHPHLVFEYNYETNTLEYKMLVFPYDSVPIEIVYIK